MTDQEIEERAKLMRSPRTRQLGEEYHLAAALAQARPQERAFVAALDAAILRRVGRQCRSLAVAQCNREWTERDERRRARLKKQIETIAGWYGLTASVGGDPRGAVVRLYGDIVGAGWSEGFPVA